VGGVRRGLGGHHGGVDGLFDEGTHAFSWAGLSRHFGREV
jgi:hypothetical protein